MTFRRGFKTDANSIAREIRAEMNLKFLDPLDPSLLASHLNIQVLTLSELAMEAPVIRHVISQEPEAFSAVTVFYGSERTIVHNDGHSIPRQNSNLAHELAHGLLLHPPTPALDSKGSRYWNQEIEDEAAWLAAVMLVTEEATIAIAKGQMTVREASWALGASMQMIKFRMNATGAVKRVQRARQFG